MYIKCRNESDIKNYLLLEIDFQLKKNCEIKFRNFHNYRRKKLFRKTTNKYMLWIKVLLKWWNSWIWIYHIFEWKKKSIFVFFLICGIAQIEVIYMEKKRYGQIHCFQLSKLYSSPFFFKTIFYAFYYLPDHENWS